MKFGLVAPFGNGTSRDIGFLKEFSQAIEQRGFDSLWVPEHVVFFAAEDYDSPYPYTKDGAPPWKDGMSIYDPLLIVAVASQVTRTLRFSTSVMILPLRPALLTAKEVMTLDHITGGRFELGVGSGWSAEEYAALGVPFEKRGRRFDEYIEAIRAAWRDDKASYSGETVAFKNVVLGPKPVTPGGPPFLIGGDSDAAMKRAARLGDGWYGWWAEYELEPHLEKLRAYLRQYSRDEGSDFRLKLGIPFKGTPDELAGKVEEAKRLGVVEFVFSVPISSRRLGSDLETWAQAAGVGVDAAR
jgi:probable F420-dependent oxidoreductase